MKCVVFSKAGIIASEVVDVVMTEVVCCVVFRSSSSVSVAFSVLFSVIILVIRVGRSVEL